MGSGLHSSLISSFSDYKLLLTSSNSYVKFEDLTPSSFFVILSVGRQSFSAFLSALSPSPGEKKTNDKTNEHKYWNENNSGYTYLPEKYLIGYNLRILDNDDDKQYR